MHIKCLQSGYRVLLHRNVLLQHCHNVTNSVSNVTFSKLGEVTFILGVVGFFGKIITLAHNTLAMTRGIVSPLGLLYCKFSVGWGSLSTCVLDYHALLLLVSDC